MAQWISHLLGKREALGLDPHTQVKAGPGSVCLECQHWVAEGGGSQRLTG